ncbi:Probable LRR receptor-like serine/threonine-protein kinase At3g47570 [Linum grandiflorum]
MITSDSLGALSSWNDSIHFCEWHGVSCSARHYGRVTALRLRSQGLSGSISTHVGNLSFLKEIPSEIGCLHRLQKLLLSNNSLDGEIPSNISRCSALIWLGVEYNELAGELPWQFCQLSKLQRFVATENNLRGSIPPTFGNLSSLGIFYLDNNQLSGRVPATLGQLKSIQLLSFGGNNLSGEIPSSIFNLSSFTEMWLGRNQFHGILPWNLGLLLPNLEVFDVEINQFTGSIPFSLSNASKLVRLQLGDNNFTGSMPSMEVSNQLIGFSIPGNSLGSGKDNDLNFLTSLTNATNLVDIIISENNFGGSLPKDIGNLSTNLRLLSFSNNKIYGNIPSGIQYFVNLEVLAASNNNLSGPISSSIGNLKSLKKMFLDTNKLFGYIPSSIGNLTELLELYIGYNHLHGEIPTSIQNCQRLLYFDLSGNNLSGVISPQVMNLASLSIVLDLSDNQFTGDLPTEVGNLKKLGTLDLSHNMLSGSIPSSLGGCIQKLDLSSNNLSGQIPKFLELIEVPTQGIFKNSSIISIIGNGKLCGGVVALKLPPCNFTIHSNKRLSLKWKIVISTISSLLFLAFIAFALYILWIKQRGRRDAVSTDDPKLLQLSYQRLFKATNGFSSTNRIGVGSFGTVYKGVLDDISEITINIAVKVFNLQRRGASKSFIAECEALKNIRHRNLVKIVTVCSSVDHEGNDFKALIYEFLANGSLEDWLYQPVERIDESTTRSLNFIQRLKIAIDIASAVDYLHNNCGTPIVHCDLKPSNVLLGEDIVAHVGDFGLARFLSTVDNPSSNTIGIKGTVGYAPPEYGMGNDVSIQGDVYSYGILLLELYTGKRPTNEIFRDGLSLHNVVMGAVLEKRTLEVVDPILLNELLRKLTTHHNYTKSGSLEEARKEQEELMSSILQIGIACSSDIPEERISMNEVLFRFTAVEKKICPVEKR